MTEESLKQKTAKGLFWGGISNGIQQLVGAVFGIIIMRILSPDDYGLVGMLAIFSAIATTFIDSGFTIALINRKEIEKEDYNAVFWFSLFIGLFFYVLLFFLAPLIAKFYDNELLVNLSRVLFLTFLLNSMGVAHYAMLFKKVMVKERAKIDIVSVIVSGCVGLWFAINGFAYWGIVLQMISYSAITLILRWRYSPFKPTFSIELFRLRGMFLFSSKLLITNIFLQISNNIFSVLLGKLYGEKQVGFYSQGYKWFTISSSLISGMISSVSQPILVEVNEEKERQVNIFRKLIRFGAFVSFPCMFGFAFIGKEFILVTVGEKWLESIPFLQIFCLWGGFIFLWVLYTNILLVYGKSTIYMFSIILVSILQLVALLLIVPFGIFPMVYAYVFISFVGLLILHYFVNKLIYIRLLDVIKDIIPYIVSTLVVLTATYLLTSFIANIYLLLLLKIAIAVMMYIVIMRYADSVIYNECIAFIKQKYRKNG